MLLSLEFSLRWVRREAAAAATAADTPTLQDKFLTNFSLQTMHWKRERNRPAVKGREMKPKSDSEALHLHVITITPGRELRTRSPNEQKRRVLMFPGLSPHTETLPREWEKHPAPDALAPTQHVPQASQARPG